MVIVVVMTNTEGETSPVANYKVCVSWLSNLRHERYRVFVTVKAFSGLEDVSFFISVGGENSTCPGTAPISPAFPAVPVGIQMFYRIGPISCSSLGTLNFDAISWFQLWRAIIKREVISPVFA